MSFPIIPRYRSGASGYPASLMLGEIAVNTHTGNVYMGSDEGVIQVGIVAAAGTITTEITGDGETSFFPINGYNGNSPDGYIVSVGGIDQPPSKFSLTTASGGTILFVEPPPLGALVSVRAIISGGGGIGGGITTEHGGVAWSSTKSYSEGDIAVISGSEHSFVSQSNSNVGHYPADDVTGNFWQYLHADALSIANRKVSAVAPTDGQVLAWSSVRNQWEPTTLTAGGGGSAPVVAQQPISQLISGNSGSYFVSAAGTTPLSYNWQISSNGSTFTSTGVTTDTYVTTDVSNDTKYVRCVITNAYGSTTSNSAYIKWEPRITYFSGDFSVSQESTTISGVTVVGDGDIYYQWQHSYDGSNFSDLSGAVAASFTYPVLTNATTYYRCKITTDYGVVYTNAGTATFVGNSLTMSSTTGASFRACDPGFAIFVSGSAGAGANGGNGQRGQNGYLDPNSGYGIQGDDGADGQDGAAGKTILLNGNPFIAGGAGGAGGYGGGGGGAPYVPGAGNDTVSYGKNGRGPNGGGGAGGAGNNYGGYGGINGGSPGETVYGSNENGGAGGAGYSDGSGYGYGGNGGDGGFDSGGDGAGRGGGGGPQSGGGGGGGSIGGTAGSGGYGGGGFAGQPGGSLSITESFTNIFMNGLPVTISFTGGNGDASITMSW